jgi:RHS repeat-associated protein
MALPPPQRPPARRRPPLPDPAAMSLFQAARIGDPITHTSALAGFLAGAVAGIALVAFVAFATFTCGFGVALLAGAMAGLGAAGVLSLGEAIGRSISAPAGSILTGARNVYVNSRLSALATASTVACSKHHLVPLVAEGSSNVFIHGLPAARQGDATTCGGTIGNSSPDTHIGGGRVRYLPVDDEVPAWLRTAVDWAFTLAGLVGGLAGLAKAAGGLSRALLPCAARFTAGFVLGEAAGRYIIAPAVGDVVRRVYGGLVGHPVDVTTGRKLLLAADEIDAELPGALPLQVARFYASDLGHAGSLGPGWVLPWELQLQRRDGRLWLRDAQGRETGFPLLQPGESAYSETEQKTLLCTATGRHVLVGLDEVYHDFGPLPQPAAGRLVVGDAGGPGAAAHGDEGSDPPTAHLQRIEDRCGQWLHLHRSEDSTNTSQRVALISSSAGWRLRLSYLHHKLRLTQIALEYRGRTDPLVRYEYDEQDQLARVIDARGQVVRRFEYTHGAGHVLMSAHANALGWQCRYEWQTLGGQPRVVRAETSDGTWTAFSYDLENRRTWARDEQGREAAWQYDAHHQVTHCVDWDGARYAVEYTESGHPAVLHLPAEPGQPRQVRFELVEAGRIVAETDPVGRSTRTRYDGQSLRPAEVTGPDGSRWRWQYDELGRLLSSEDPLGRRERYEYAPPQRTSDEPDAPLSDLPRPWPVAHIDPKGGRRSFKWDRRGLLQAVTDCSGHTTRYEYGTLGLLSAVTDALGHATRMERLPTGQIRRIERADGSWQELQHDAAGLPVHQSDHAGRAWTWQRNPRGQVVASTDPAGRTLTYNYDPQGRLAALRSETGAYGFSYDAGGRLSVETRPDGVQRRLQYGAFGELRAVTLVGVTAHGPAPVGISPDDQPLDLGPQRTSHHERDALGRLLAQSSPTAVTRYTWDAAGRLGQAERTPTAAGRDLGVTADTVTLQYDAAGRLVAEVGREGTVRYDLDNGDHLVGLSLPHGPKLDWLSYGSGHVHQVRSGGEVVTDIERDELHREVMRTQGRLRSEQGFDALGRRTWQSAGFVPGSGLSAEAARGARTLAPAPGQGTVWRRYQYSPAGELAVQEDGLRGTLAFQYDEAGQLLKRTQWHPGRGQADLERFAWDAAGNLIDAARHGGASAGRVEGNRLRMWQDCRFDYDPWGNLIAKQRGAHRKQVFRFDAEDRLVAVTDEGPHGPPGTETHFEYDALGRRIGRRMVRRDATGRTVHTDERRFVWQGLRLAQEIRGSGGTSSYVYSPDAPYTPMARVDSCTMQAAQAMGAAAPGQQVYHFHTDPVGTPLEVTDEQGELAWAGDYAAWGRVRQQAGPHTTACIEQNLRLPGQYADDSTGLHYNTFRYYDPDLGRFISPDPIGLAGGENLYLYAPNPTGWMDPWGWCPTGSSTKTGPTSSTKVVELPEVTAPKPIKPEAAVAEWDKFLGPGPHTNTHPRTGVPDANRIVSADRTRSIRYGNHEMGSKPTKHHYHEETWTYDAATDTMTVANTIKRVPLN